MSLREPDTIVSEPLEQKESEASGEKDHDSDEARSDASKPSGQCPSLPSQALAIATQPDYG